MKENGGISILKSSLRILGKVWIPRKVLLSVYNVLFIMQGEIDMSLFLQFCREARPKTDREICKKKANLD